MIPTIGGFDQHDDFDPDRPHRAANVDTPYDRWMPHGDLVLVKRLPDKDKIGSIFIPETAQNAQRGTRRGLVLMVGPGDKIVAFECESCGCFPLRLLKKQIYLKCRNCGGSLRLAATDNFVWGENGDRSPLNVAVGDEVIYWRAEANDVKIQNVEYVYLHEEQHILAVLEKAS